MSHWVLTEDVNDYDQHGSYYTCSWNQKPTVSQLMLCRKVGMTQLTEEASLVLLESGSWSPKPSDSLWSYFSLTEIH